jgi:uncharacterized protein
MLVDANLLLYAVNEASAQHAPVRDWLADRLNGDRRVGLPWQVLGSFLRIATHPRAFERPLGAERAWRQVTEWLAAPVAWIPAPGAGHAELLGELIRRYDLRGNLVPDAQIAALALEHGLTIYSADTDFARFEELRWENPAAPARG